MIRKITVSMDNFSESFMARLKLEQLVAKDDENRNAARPASQVCVNSSAAAAPQMRPASQIPGNVPLSQYAQNHYTQMPQNPAVNPAVPQGCAAAGNQVPGNMQYSAGNSSVYQSRYTYTPDNSYSPAANNTVSQPAGNTVPQAGQMSFEAMGGDPDESMKG